jgi:hypothetical protein
MAYGIFTRISGPDHHGEFAALFQTQRDRRRLLGRRGSTQHEFGVDEVNGDAFTVPRISTRSASPGSLSEDHAEPHVSCQT